MLICPLLQGSGALSSGGSEIQAEDACSNSSRDRDSPSDCLSPGPPLPPPSSSSSFGRPPPPSNLNSHAAAQPLSLSTFDLDRLSDEHLRAKRARVENIIRGMSHSPLVRPNTGDHNQHHSHGETVFTQTIWGPKRIALMVLCGLSDGTIIFHLPFRNTISAHFRTYNITL